MEWERTECRWVIAGGHAGGKGVSSGEGGGRLCEVGRGRGEGIYY